MDRKSDQEERDSPAHRVDPASGVGEKETDPDPNHKVGRTIPARVLAEKFVHFLNICHHADLLILSSNHY